MEAACGHADLKASAHNKKSFRVVVEDIFCCSLDVSDPSNRRAVLRIPDVKRNIQLDLTSRSNTLLEAPHELSVSFFGGSSAEIPGQDDLIFRIGLFGNKGPRKIEVGRRPIFCAERSKVSDDQIDLLFCQYIAKRRHLLRPTRHRPALGNHKGPVSITLF